MTDKLGALIESTAAECDFSGVVSITRNGGDVLYQNAFGFRDIKNRLPNTLATRFGTASGTKLFTALGIGRLIDRGLLALTTTMSEIDADFRGFIDENATILNLLTHTSGVYDYYDEEEIRDFDNYAVEIPWFQLTTPLDYLPLFKKRIKFQPNERYSYSNGGFVLLGIIIERISGQLYRDFVTENVLRPAGMDDSGFYAFNDLPENTAWGYLHDRRTINIYNLPLRGGGDGGMYTTAQDLQRFWENLFGGKILSQGLTEEYLKTRCELSPGNGYGCGIYKKLDGSAFSTAGSDAGIGFFSRHYVGERMTASVLSNVTDGEGEVVRTILQELDHLT